MQWFKHQSDARHDPFIWDLRKKFGAEGYFVYFATVEIYADSYKSEPGWFLDISIEYLKHELNIYHSAKLMRILDYIRSWPDVERAGAEKINLTKGDDKPATVTAPKWIAQLSKNRVALLIPAFEKIMDNYTAQKTRGKNTGSSTGPPAGIEQAAMIFRDIARDCELIEKMPAKNGHKFTPADFVGWCVKNNYHPGAIKDGTEALIKQWPTIKDPWPWARGVVSSRAQHYKGTAFNANNAKAIYGGFFNKR
jgi:hypothetical protein